ncbi:hypothetical protein SAMN05421676_11580 [Salinibacillus kushneri]|uniref:Uncharacterized protein n=1 Tax=Salinibacillus kushneri TaxID=237682 RepID=A0A1I0J2N9_9BACI|nr:hypothetical protein [Salinibacillus kushneri]SEU04044.1 hypothetical protein SAMN05421676_11580 [Salinibacillus kushneri]
MQPVISSFTFSEDSQNSTNQNGRGNALHVINPQNLFRPPFIPCTFSFSVTFGVISLNPNIDSSLEFRLISPNQEVVVSTNEVNIPKNSNFDSTLPEEANGFMFNFDFRNVPLRESGKYTANILINEEVIGEFPLMVHPKEN